MKRWGLILLLLLSVGVNIGILSTLGVSRLRRPEPRDRAFRPPQPPPEVRSLPGRFGLDRAEAETFRELHRTFFEKTTEGQREAFRLRRELADELTSEAPERERLDEILDRIVANERAREEAFVELTMGARELLGGEGSEAYRRFVRQKMVRGPGPSDGPWRGRHGEGDRPRPR